MKRRFVAENTGSWVKLLVAACRLTERKKECSEEVGQFLGFGHLSLSLSRPSP